MFNLEKNHYFVLIDSSCDQRHIFEVIQDMINNNTEQGAATNQPDSMNIQKPVKIIREVITEADKQVNNLEKLIELWKSDDLYSKECINHHLLYITADNTVNNPTFVTQAVNQTSSKPTNPIEKFYGKEHILESKIQLKNQTRKTETSNFNEVYYKILLIALRQDFYAIQLQLNSQNKEKIIKGQNWLHRMLQNIQ